MTTASASTVTVNLSVAATESGGNAGGGKYVYSYDPDIVTITESPTLVVYRFSEETDKNFEMLDIYTTDSKYQLSPAKPASDSRSLSLNNVNTQAQLIFLSTRVKDTKTGSIFNCDPQMINVPVTR
jgi:hypothetical protein